MNIFYKFLYIKMHNNDKFKGHVLLLNISKPKNIGTIIRL